MPLKGCSCDLQVDENGNSTNNLFVDFTVLENIGYFVPTFIFELVVGFWLLLRGIRTSGIDVDSQQSLA
jgi:hypothetical protein